MQRQPPFVRYRKFVLAGESLLAVAIWKVQSALSTYTHHNHSLFSNAKPCYAGESLLTLIPSPNAHKLTTHSFQKQLNEDGSIIDRRSFQHNQVRLDKKEYEAKLVKRQEDMQMDRAIEVLLHGFGIYKIALF